VNHDGRGRQHETCTKDFEKNSSADLRPTHCGASQHQATIRQQPWKLVTTRTLGPGAAFLLIGCSHYDRPPSTYRLCFGTLSHPGGGWWSLQSSERLPEGQTVHLLHSPFQHLPTQGELRDTQRHSATFRGSYFQVSSATTTSHSLEHPPSEHSRVLLKKDEALTTTWSPKPWVSEPESDQAPPPNAGGPALGWRDSDVLGSTPKPRGSIRGRMHAPPPHAMVTPRCVRSVTLTVLLANVQLVIATTTGAVDKKGPPPPDTNNAPPPTNSSTSVPPTPVTLATTQVSQESDVGCDEYSVVQRPQRVNLPRDLNCSAPPPPPANRYTSPAGSGSTKLSFAWPPTSVMPVKFTALVHVKVLFVPSQSMVVTAEPPPVTVSGLATTTPQLEGPYQPPAIMTCRGVDDGTPATLLTAKRREAHADVAFGPQPAVS
jgi:hypothetical protein